MKVLGETKYFKTLMVHFCVHFRKQIVRVFMAFNVFLRGSTRNFPCEKEALFSEKELRVMVS